MAAARFWMAAARGQRLALRRVRNWEPGVEAGLLCVLSLPWEYHRFRGVWWDGAWGGHGGMSHVDLLMRSALGLHLDESRLGFADNLIGGRMALVPSPLCL